jgi:response regulator RpfG family c-di-GMP phosphodiesterase
VSVKDRLVGTRLRVLDRPASGPGKPHGSTLPASRLADGKERARILISDDCPELLAVVKRALADNYLCEFASDVEAAREMLAAGPFELALCDVSGPGQSGMTLAEEIIMGGLDTAVVVVADADDPEEAMRAFDFGAYGYIVRPPLPGQLLMTTMNALRRRELEIIAREHSQNLEDRGQAIVDRAPMPIYAKDASGRYLMSNAKADELASVGRGEMVGLSDGAIMSPEGARKAAGIDRRILEDGLVYEAEEPLVVGGVPRTFKTIKFPLLDGEGEITAVGGISVDVTAENETIRLHHELVCSQQKAIDELRVSREETVERLVRAIEQHDLSTGQHVNRIGAIAAFLASRLGLDSARVELLRIAAPMHDVGKIGVPDEILQKPGALTAEERRRMQRHTVVGHEILSESESELLRVAASVALTHHERFDGNGYPRGLAGAAIPIEGRITAVADVFDALLSDRCYRPAMPTEEAVRVIAGGRGTQFDPRVVDILLAHLDELLALRGPDSASSDRAGGDCGELP